MHCCVGNIYFIIFYVQLMGELQTVDNVCLTLDLFSVSILLSSESENSSTAIKLQISIEIPTSYNQ